jgi:hypothetical protein
MGIPQALAIALLFSAPVIEAQDAPEASATEPESATPTSDASNIEDANDTPQDSIPDGASLWTLNHGERGIAFVGSIASVIGLWLSWMAWTEAINARNAAIGAREAAEAAEAAAIRRIAAHRVAEVRHSFTVVEQCIVDKQWPIAAMQMGTLVDLLKELSHSDPDIPAIESQWTPFAARLQELRIECLTIPTADRKKAFSKMNEWVRLHDEVKTVTIGITSQFVEVGGVAEEATQ